jgi:hypothetical protein
MLKTIIFYAALGILFLAIGIFEWLEMWLALPAFSCFLLYATFLCGRFFENGKCWGFKKYEDF